MFPRLRGGVSSHKTELPQNVRLRRKDATFQLLNATPGPFKTCMLQELCPAHLQRRRKAGPEPGISTAQLSPRLAPQSMTESFLSFFFGETSKGLTGLGWFEVPIGGLGFHSKPRLRSSEFGVWDRLFQKYVKQ